MRFRMLEIIRDSAQLLLDADDWQTTRRRHAQWMVDLAEHASVEYPTQEDFLRFDAVQQERDNLREAIRFALDSDPTLAFRFAVALPFYWRYRSNGFEALRFYQELFERYGSTPASKEIARAAFGAAVLIQMFPAHRDGGKFRDRALLSCQRNDLQAEAAKVLAMKAMSAQNEQEYDDVAAFISAAEELGEQYGSACDRASIAYTRGFICYNQGLQSESVPLGIEASVAVFTNEGEVFQQVRARLVLALATIEIKRFDRSEAALGGVLATIRQARLAPLLAIAYNAMGEVAFARRPIQPGT